jgi:hypothetical protein
MCGCVVYSVIKWEELTGGKTELRNVELRKNLYFHCITEFHDLLNAKERRFDEFR